MLAPRSKRLAASRRRVDDEGEDEEGSVLAGADDDSMSETSAISDADEDADAEGSDASDLELDRPSDRPNKASVNGQPRSAPASRSLATRASPEKPSFAVITDDTAAMMNGLNIVGNADDAEEIHFDDLAQKSQDPAVEPAPAPVQAGTAPALNPADKRRQEHEEYRKRRDADPAFVPNRGGFFMHDHRSAAPGQNGFRPFGRGRGRGRGAFGGVPSSTKYSLLLLTLRLQGTADAQWSHDLHETVTQPEPEPTSAIVARTNQAVQATPITPSTPNNLPPNRSFSRTTRIGKVQIRVFLSGMAEPIVIPAITVNQHTRLPHHRPPLRRDKPVRVSIPAMPIRYIFPSIDRSFIFIPRALRPNQQGFGRARARGSFSIGYGPLSSRRTSVYAGSAYSPSVALSRRSSLAREIAADAIVAPGLPLSRPSNIPTEPGKPVVRLPPAAQQGTALTASETAAGQEYPIVNLPQAPVYPLPEKPTYRENRPAPIPMHQPKPQKAVSVTDIESPASFAFNPPQQQDQQPFHQQVPHQVIQQTYQQDPSLYPHSRHPSHPSQASGGTPLSQIPERAAHALPFQPYAYQQAPAFYPPQYPPTLYYYPTTDQLQAGGPSAMAPAFIPGQPYPYSIPLGPVPPTTEATSQPVTVAHESNGMVYYYDSSQLNANGEGQTSFAGADYTVPQGGGGVVGMGVVIVSLFDDRASAIMASINAAPTSDTPIAIKLALSNGENRRFKLPLKDLGANTLPQKLRSLLALPPNQNVVFERFSDSAGSYIALDSNNPAVYKQLFRAAKAKLKLRLKATISDAPEAQVDSAAPSAQLPASCYSPPEKIDTFQIGTKAAVEEQLLNGLVAPNVHGTPAVKSSIDLDQSLPRNTLRAKLPYDPCLSPIVAAPTSPSLLDTANPAMNEADAYKPTPVSLETICGTHHALQDYLMQMMLLEQQNKKRLLMARAEQDNLTEAPVPDKFEFPSDKPSKGLALTPQLRDVKYYSKAAGSKCPTVHPVAGSFIISCNKCQANVPDAHWHCSTCNWGDFDLCGQCIEKGILCEGEDHWLIKRTIKNGKVLNSTTETIAPKKVEATKAVPEAVPASAENNEDSEDTDMYRTWRNIRHYAICDGCDKVGFSIPLHGPPTERSQDIYGTRHKCLNCPDWDYCSACMKGARASHPGHRFVPLNEPIPFSTQRSPTHYNINCDGPLCKDYHGYIVGDRYKCAVCHDTDFCAKCEASPSNRHNRTHPLIKFKSPVRNVSVTTVGEKENGEQMCAMGDQQPKFASKATETVPAAATADAATQPQTAPSTKSENTKADGIQTVLSTELQAHFVRDAVADGTVFPPSKQFGQIWTIRNPGPHVWPAGCSVHFTGGDTMFNVDPNHPSSVNELVKATESNVVTHEVAVGEATDFIVMMRTPERQGKAISYWRLKSPEGVAFGHKLWCDIVVKKAGVDAEGAVVSVKEEEKPVAAASEHGVAATADVKKEEVDVASSSTHSQMIFPKLDKESTVLEIHEAAATAPSVVAPSAAAVPAIVTAKEEKELLEEVENLDLEDDHSVESDDGFMTDEEFELLEASEDDFAEAVNGKVKK
ncbi:MAG: hypothetical protein Q9203_001566 [Teloschistes exilis]